MEKIRVLHIVGKMERGGLETMIMNFYRNINKSKVQFDFIVHGEEKGFFDDEILKMGGKIYHVRKKSDSFLGNLKDIYNVIYNNQYKIVHVHQDAMSMFALREAKRAGVSIRIAHAHSTSMPPSLLGKIIYPYALKRTNKYATHKFACSEASAKYLFNRNTSNVVIFKNAINTQRFTFIPEEYQSVREKYNLNGNFVIGHIANFLYPKNHDFVIEIFKELLKKRTNSKLLLCGSGQLLEQYKNKVIESDLQENIIFMGNIDNVNEIMQGLDAFILPSLYEGFPVVLVEAQCEGLPCFVSNVITKETKITDNIHYLSLNAGPEKWSDEILKVVSSNRKDFSDEIYKSGFDILDVSKKLEDVYLSLADRLK